MTSKIARLRTALLVLGCFVFSFNQNACAEIFDCGSNVVDSEIDSVSAALGCGGGFSGVSVDVLPGALVLGSVIAGEDATIHVHGGTIRGGLHASGGFVALWEGVVEGDGSAADESSLAMHGGVINGDVILSDGFLMTDGIIEGDVRTFASFGNATFQGGSILGAFVAGNHELASTFEGYGFHLDGEPLRTNQITGPLTGILSGKWRDGTVFSVQLDLPDANPTWPATVRLKTVPEPKPAVFLPAFIAIVCCLRRTYSCAQANRAT